MSGWPLFRVLVLSAFAVAIPDRAAAQAARYVGFAEGFSAEGGLVGAIAPPPASVGAGGSGEDREKVCDVAEELCFDETAAGAGIPGILTTGEVQTIGGARSETGDPRPGFPRVESIVSGTLLQVPGVLQVLTGSGRAVADAETGELSADLGAALVTLAGGAVIPVPPGETIDIPGIATFFGSTSRIIEDDGLKVIEIETGRMESAVLGNATFGRAAAGLELAATSGGSFGGGGGCSVAPGGDAADGKLVVGLLVLLGGAAFRRRWR